MTAVPSTPSLVAVMFAVPILFAVTTPDADTVATGLLFELHVIRRPVRTFPFASFNVAVRETVPSTETSAVAGVTVTDATGAGVTVTVEEPDCPSLVAVIVAVPAATPVTTPAGDTVATALLLVLHAMARPVSTAP
jgi:hypothetical protein